jgi:ribose transport system ATP-binding protein
MVEIARAVSDPELKILILDEPTSSLPSAQTQQLQTYLKDTAKAGLTYIYISHRLKEVMHLADRIVIMSNGVEIWQGGIEQTSEEDMIRRMGEGLGSLDHTNHSSQQGPDQAPVAAQSEPKTPSPAEPGATATAPAGLRAKVTLNHHSSRGLKDISLSFSAGQIVGVTGLEGNGQVELLHEIHKLAGGKSGGAVRGKVAYIAGDRKKEGLFPLWSIADNLILSKVASEPLFIPLDGKKLNQTVQTWSEKFRIKSAGSQANIVSLSGGNQQKVLIARAMATEAEVILLDDPTRGVDVGTKTQIYQVFREAAAEGRLVIWRTSDDRELELCSSLVVMKGGRVAAEFNSSQVSHADILEAAFRDQSIDDKKQERASRGLPLWFFSMVAALLLVGICGYMSPRVISKFGLELLAVGFTPFVYAALSQTFVIGLGHIDLSVGAFMGLVNVLCATLLKENTAYGLLAIIGVLLIYSIMGLVVYLRRIPSIIVTLGMSFVWLGAGFILQDMPGGQTPSWLIKIFNPKNPFIEGVLIYLFLSIVIAIVIYRSRYGTVMRGFGNNDVAVVNSGWSKGRAFFMIYLVAGLFATMGGVAFSAITGASDVNASSTFTLLTVAAVIIGGGYFSGGVVTHLGAVLGAISLTMISVLLGMMNISTDYTATIHGLVLLVILSLIILKGGGAAIND